MDEPLIYTSKGNLPERSLEYSKEWEFDNDSIKFSETYKLNGEVVKQSAHVFVLRGHDLGTLQGKF
jgi:hypothetical protein